MITLVVNSRGCAKTELKTPRLYSGAETSDLHFAMRFIKKEYPITKIIGCGFSLGANILTKYCAEYKNNVFDGIISIANPYCFITTSNALHRSVLGKVYSRRIASNLKENILSNHSIFCNLEIYDKTEIEDIRDLKEFDNICTSRAFQYKSGMDYYRHASSAKYIPDLDIYTLCLHSLDDPIAYFEGIPYHEILKNDKVVFVATSVGVHIGWFSLGKERWFVDPVIEFCGLICKRSDIFGKEGIREEKRRESKYLFEYRGLLLSGILGYIIGRLF